MLHGKKTKQTTTKKPQCGQSCHNMLFFKYLKPKRNCKDNGPDRHEDESSHEHQPPAKALNQQVLKQTKKNST